MTIMDFYFAPMEGITLFPFRDVHHRHFPGTERYFTPFLVANQTLHFKNREIRDVLPGNNLGIHVVPQVLSNKAEEFLWAARELQDYGWHEVNLNLGCPSPTVCTHAKGAGFLAFPERLDQFFDQVFRELERDGSSGLKISVKTRTGVSDPEEIRELMKIFNRYPLCELIVHPRLKKDLYKGSPDLETFAYVMEESRHPVCYNGDITSKEDLEKLTQAFPALAKVMIGRGLVRDPSLVWQLQGKEAADAGHLRAYHDELYQRYEDVIYGDLNVINKMKEIWSYMKDLFQDHEKAMKKIRKAKTRDQYREAADQMFSLPLRQ